MQKLKPINKSINLIILIIIDHRKEDEVNEGKGHF